MKHTLYTISIPDLLLTLIPLFLLMGVFWAWSIKVGTSLYATARMVIQLVVIGFLLTFIFNSENVFLFCAILFVMLSVASWIALRPLGENRRPYYVKAFISLGVVCLCVLALIIFVVIRPTPWYLPTYLIPLAGMIFANSMNTLSLAAERFKRELASGAPYQEARKVALSASLIPPTNMFMAVGIVSLPGMMTGQILSGVDPLIAARYQMLILATIYGSGGLSAALYLSLSRPKPVEA